MKILMLAQEDPMHPGGGLGVHLHHLATELSVLGVEVTVVATDLRTQQGGLWICKDGKYILSHKDDWATSAGNWRLLNVFNANDLSLQESNAAFTNLITLENYNKSILHFLKDDEFDLIHVHDSSVWRSASLFSDYFDAKVIYSCHLLSSRLLQEENLYADHLDSVKYIVQTELSGLHQSHGVIAVSEAYKKECESLFVHPPKIVAIHNGVSVPDVKFSSKLYEKARNGKEKLVVFVGRMSGQKGIDEIIDTAATQPQFQFYLVSSISPTAEDLCRLCSEVQNYKGDNLVWLNQFPQKDKWELMKAADIGVVASTHEPFGIVALEWMALGVPLVTTTCDGLGEFCNAENSFPYERGQLAEALESVNLYTIEAGYETARHFTWAKTAKETLDYYAKIID